MGKGGVPPGRRVVQGPVCSSEVDRVTEGGRVIRRRVVLTQLGTSEDRLHTPVVGGTNTSSDDSSVGYVRTHTWG